MNKFLIYVALYAAPLFVGAADLNVDFRSMVYEQIFPLGNALMVFFVVLALLFFLWGAAQFIVALGKGDEKGIEARKPILIWGIVALVVMVSIWSIVRLATTTLGLSSGSFLYPQFKTNLP